MIDQDKTCSEFKINDDNNLVPENTIVIVTEDESWDSSVNDIILPLKGQTKRDWFIKHAYFCLPLLIGNQYGFAIRSYYDFEAEWNGGDHSSDLIVKVDMADNLNTQVISSHFGMGLVTIQNRFNFRTPKGVNLMTMDPPNVINPYLRNMTAVVETDNLRRDFTFNIKLTVPNVKVKVKKGDIISCILPIPRFYVDNYSIKMAKDVFSKDVIDKERDHGRRLGEERLGPDQLKPNGNGRRYFDGIDIEGNAFYKHQKNMASTSPKDTPQVLKIKKAKVKGKLTTGSNLSKLLKT